MTNRPYSTPVGQRFLGRALAAAVSLGACSQAESPTQPVVPEPVVTAVTPTISLIPSPSDASAQPVNRIHAVARRADGAVLDESTEDIAPTADWETQLRITDEDGATLSIYVDLIHVAPGGQEDLQFSGYSAAFTLSAGTPVSPQVPVVRGPLSNLSVTSVTISSAPDSMLEGEDADLVASASTSDGSAATVFWTSLDPGIVGVDSARATAIVAGSARLVASAGAHADTTVVLVTAPDTAAPTVVSTAPGDADTDVDPEESITAVLDEDLDVATVSASTFTLRYGLGVVVPATVSYSGRVATLTPDAPLDYERRYTATLSTGLQDLAGNGLANAVSWSFTTEPPPLPTPSLVTSFDAGLGRLVAIGFDDASTNLFVYRDRTTSIRVFTKAGSEVTPSVPLPGTPSNEIDFDFLTVPTTIDGAAIPANTLLVHNGEVDPGTLYAVDQATGATLASLEMPVAGNPVGGSFHPGRKSFFSVNYVDDTITEVDLETGVELGSFSANPPGAPFFTVFFGDIEVEPSTGYLLVVSSTSDDLRILTPTGELVRDVPIRGVVDSYITGIAWDSATSTAWFSTGDGRVFQVADIL